MADNRREEREGEFLSLESQKKNKKKSQQIKIKRVIYNPSKLRRFDKEKVCVSLHGSTRDSRINPVRPALTYSKLTADVASSWPSVSLTLIRTVRSVYFYQRPLTHFIRIFRYV